jgi:hypothetical protein
MKHRHAVEVFESPVHGLDVQAIRALRAGQTIMRVIVDENYKHYHHYSVQSLTLAVHHHDVMRASRQRRDSESEQASHLRCCCDCR